MVIVNQFDLSSVFGLHRQLHDGDPEHRGTVWRTSLCSEVNKSKVKALKITQKTKKMLYFDKSSIHRFFSQTVRISRQRTFGDISHFPLWRHGGCQVWRWEKRGGQIFLHFHFLFQKQILGGVHEHSGGAAPPCDPEERRPRRPALLLLWDRGQARHQQLRRARRVSQQYQIYDQIGQNIKQFLSKFLIKSDKI